MKKNEILRSPQVKQPSLLLYIFGLYTIAVLIPLFKLVANNPQLFIARQLSTLELWLTLLSWIIVPLVLGVIMLRLPFAKKQVQQIGYGLIAIEISLIAAQLLKEVLPFGGMVILLSLVLGAGLTALFARSEMFQTFLRALSGMAIVYFLFVLGFSPLSRLLVSTAQPSAQQVFPIRKPVPIVMLVLDELPTYALLNEQGQIDANRLPNFAKLARQATLYRNTLTAADNTLQAVPAIMSGLMPSPERTPNFQGHPKSLFTLLGSNYKLNVIESRTDICPEYLCPKNKNFGQITNQVQTIIQDLGYVYLYILLPESFRSILPDITNDWVNYAAGNDRLDKLTTKERQLLVKKLQTANIKNRLVISKDRAELFQEFLARIQPADSSKVLHFLHIVLPHSGYNYLPSGRYYTKRRGLRGMKPRTHIFEDERGRMQTYQRYLLQVGYADLLLGQLIERLKRTGLYDNALLIVVADHGVSFRLGEDYRVASPVNYNDIMYVPLFIKLPGQTQGSISQTQATTMDIVPTIRDLLEVEPNWSFDGQSLLVSKATESLKARICSKTGCSSFPIEPGAIENNVRMRIATFGDGSNPLQLFRIGPFKQLLGQPLAQLSVSESKHFFELEDNQQYQNVRLNSEFLPVLVRGEIHWNLRHDKPQAQDYAVAINDRIWGLYPYLATESVDKLKFHFLVPESAFRDGVNTIRFFAVRETAHKPHLHELQQKI